MSQKTKFKPWDIPCLYDQKAVILQYETRAYDQRNKQSSSEKRIIGTRLEKL